MSTPYMPDPGVPQAGGMVQSTQPGSLSGAFGEGGAGLGVGDGGAGSASLPATGAGLPSPRRGFGSTALERQQAREQYELSRQLSHVEGTAIVRAAKVQVETALSTMKVEAATTIGRTAQVEVAMLTQVEAELTKAIPLAANRLELLGNMTTMQVAELTASAVERLRRL